MDIVTASLLFASVGMVCITTLVAMHKHHTFKRDKSHEAIFEELSDEIESKMQKLYDLEKKVNAMALKMGMMP